MSTELTAPGSSSILNKKIRPSDLILTVLIDLAAAFSILLLIAIMGYVFFRGLPQISLSFLTSVPSTIKGTFGIEHKIDTKAFASALASDSIPDEAMDGIRTKYELDKKGYDSLDADLQLILDDFITSKPTMPTLEIKYDD